MLPKTSFSSVEQVLFNISDRNYSPPLDLQIFLIDSQHIVEPVTTNLEDFLKYMTNVVMRIYIYIIKNITNIYIYQRFEIIVRGFVFRYICLK